MDKRDLYCSSHLTRKESYLLFLINGTEDELPLLPQPLNPAEDVLYEMCVNKEYPQPNTDTTDTNTDGGSGTDGGTGGNTENTENPTE